MVKVLPTFFIFKFKATITNIYSHDNVIVIGMNLTVSEETVVELSAYLSGRKKIYEAIC